MLSAAMGALLLLGTFNVDSAQIISILRVATRKDTNLYPRTSLEYFMKCVECEAVASILRQCEQMPIPASHRSSYATASVNQSLRIEVSYDDVPASHYASSVTPRLQRFPRRRDSSVPCEKLIDLKKYNQCHSSGVQ